MSAPTYPGVYVHEVSSGVRPIQVASTSTAAFIGQAEKGDLNKAVKVFNFTEYQNRYGGFLDSSFLSHAVYQFFNNGGTQCYIVRVAGANMASANITLADRGTTPQESMTITAISPGVWGNSLAVVITDGTNDPGNEFNLAVYRQTESKPVLLETFNNLSMTPGASNFIETSAASSHYIRVTVNQANAHVAAGVSRGAAPPQPLTDTGRTRFRINLNNDGYQEVNLKDVADLSSADAIAQAIQAYVSQTLVPQRKSTDPEVFTQFTCRPDSEGKLVLTAGTSGAASAVNVAPAADRAQDASGLLKLGKLEQGVETVGAAITRPVANSTALPFYSVGDQAPSTPGVMAVNAGSDGDGIMTDQIYIDAFHALDDKTDVSLIAVPGIGSVAVVNEGVNYCANRTLSDCFFIGDMAADDDTVEEAKAFRDAISPKNSYGALYLPWLRMLDPTGKSAQPILAPPSGYMAGLYAKTDAQRGVWKAPAGTTIALAGALGLATDFTDTQQGLLNPDNINVIRQFPGAGIVPWGARTITADAEWNYIPVRRLAILLRVSIYRGIQWAVFEPNDEPLWSQLRLNINSFMMTLFRQGAFQGATPTQAFFVKCDSETTTQADIDQGIVNILVGFAPLKPAEFVVVKISQKAGQASA